MKSLQVADRSDRRPCAMRLRRLSLGLTQRDIADATGLNREHLCRIEAGRCRPHRSTKRLLALALDTDVELIFPPNEERPRPAGAEPSRRRERGTARRSRQE